MTQSIGLKKLKLWTARRDHYNQPLTTQSQKMTVSNDTQDMFPDHYNELVLEACKEASLRTLEGLFENHILFIDPTHNDSAAWKYCVSIMNRDMCKLFIKHFGYQFFGYDRSLIDACSAGNREIAMFILSLYENEQPFFDRDAMELASRKGHTEFVMKVLNGWVNNRYNDLIHMCIVAMVGAIYGKHESLFDAVLAKYKKHVTTKPHTAPEFKRIKSVAHINREILMSIASTSRFEYFNKVLNELNVDFSQGPTSDDIYAASSITTGYSDRGGARLYLFTRCCNFKDSRLIDALIAKYGLNLLLNLGKIGDDTQVLRLFNTACTNNHTSVIKLIAQHEGLTTTLPLFKVCANKNNLNACQAFVDVFGSEIVPVIEADAALHTNPTIRTIMRKFYLEMYKRYED